MANNLNCFCIAPQGGGDPQAMAKNKNISKQLKQWHKEEERQIKLLLLGTGESGKSTITKQMKIIHINGFNDSERRERAKDIRRNLKDSILSIVGAMPELRISLEDPKNQECIDYIMNNATLSEFTYPQVFYDFVERLWADRGVQESFSRASEYQLMDSARYFLEKIHLLRKDDYVPSDQDILRCRVMTNAIQRIDFSVTDRHTPVQFSVFDVGGQRGERRKWIQVFDSATAILFILDCSSFDKVLMEDTTKNRLLEAAEIFYQVWNHRYLRQVSTILFINKIDLLAEKIAAGSTFEHFLQSLNHDNPYYPIFSEFRNFEKPREIERREFVEAFPRSSPVVPNRKRSRSHSQRTDIDEEVIRTAVFIKRAFMQLIDIPRQGREGSEWHSNHTCEYFYTCAVDTNNIKKVLDGCRSLIIKKHLDRWGISLY